MQSASLNASRPVSVTSEASDNRQSQTGVSRLSSVSHQPLFTVNMTASPNPPKAMRSRSTKRQGTQTPDEAWEAVKAKIEREGWKMENLGLSTETQWAPDAKAALPAFFNEHRKGFLRDWVLAQPGVPHDKMCIGRVNRHGRTTTFAYYIQSRPSKTKEQTLSVMFAAVKTRKRHKRQ